MSHITEEFLKERVNAILATIGGIHHPCGMPHKLDEKCGPKVLTRLAYNCYLQGKKEVLSVIK